ncbi:Uncharacterized protein PBTT_10336 [Plasmodiophora brassicae]|uniref:Uncharacterized protein n=1 Tax=Plasmodiophora brassicae TaxID=37360 RepID=A0A0G4IZU6_PLABS|nr:hypothetical protein PBRA_008157 [Plasmodiophora brassicae]
MDLRRVTFRDLRPGRRHYPLRVHGRRTSRSPSRSPTRSSSREEESSTQSEGRVVSPADPFAPDARRRPIPSGPLARYLSPQDVRAQKTPQRMALRAEMESLTSLHYRDDYLKALGGQKKAITMKIHQQLADWLRLRDDQLTDDAVSLYTYEYTRLSKDMTTFDF